MKMKHVWKKNPYNSLLQGDGFHISYNPDTAFGHGSSITALGNMLGANLRDGPETALVIKNPDGPDTFHILEGDWRKQYEAVFDEGLDACLKVFEKYKKKYASNWSTEETSRKDAV